MHSRFPDLGTLIPAVCKRAIYNIETLCWPKHESPLIWLLIHVVCHCFMQVIRFREEPRVREQEWGNFQNPTEMAAVRQERRKVGAFFYRFPTGER